MQFLTQQKRSVVVNGERIWEDDKRYAELMRTTEPNASEEERKEAALQERQWQADLQQIKSWFTPWLFLKVAMWIALFYYLGQYTRPALVFVTFFYVIFTNLGKRKAGELSAYNVFNPNFQRIAGDNLAEQFEAQIRNMPVDQQRQLRQRRQTQQDNATRSAQHHDTVARGDDDDVNVDDLKPRDKVIVAYKQGKFAAYVTVTPSVPLLLA